jgi:L-ribulose-5-phosphate 3-epimerase
MRSTRREFVGHTGIALCAAAAWGVPALEAIAQNPGKSLPKRRSIGVSTYSFWQFRGERLSIPACIEKAAAMGFDGVEILHVQMQEESNAALQNIKRRAHSLGLALMGFSTHQAFQRAWNCCERALHRVSAGGTGDRYPSSIRCFQRLAHGA